MPLTPFNPMDPALLVDPYPLFSEYRENEPVHWGTATNPALPGSWYTFAYEDSSSALNDSRLKSNPASVGMTHAMPPAFEPIAHVFLEWLGALDPPKHTRLRTVTAKAFTPSRVRAFAPIIEQIAHELLDDALSSGEEFDLVTSYAFPLPMKVIGDMLGVPPEDREQFRELSTVFAKAIDNPGDVEAATAGSAATEQMLEYFGHQVALRRKQPQDDVLNTMLVAADDDGQAMTEFEVLATAIELIVAGHETTVNTVTKATYNLLQTDDYERLAADPDRIVGPALEEVLRWTSPLQRQRNRWVTEPMELGGVKLEVGDSVVVMLGAANHDPSLFTNPDRLDLDRPVSRHLTFGYGPHFCLGAALARLEVGTALRTLLKRVPNLEITGDVAWRRNFLIPGPEELTVRAGGR